MQSLEGPLSPNERTFLDIRTKGREQIKCDMLRSFVHLPYQRNDTLAIFKKAAVK